MSDETVYNLLRGTSAQAQTSTGYAAFKFALTKALEVGKTYTFSVDVDELSSSATDSPYIGPNDGNGRVRYCTLYGTGHKVGTFTVGNLNRDESAYDFASFAIYNTPGLAGSLSATKRLVIRNAMLVEGDTPAAWAPADGEELAGGGAQMSANLWDVSTGTFRPDASGVYLVGKSTGGLQSAITGASALAEDQTIHMGASLRGAGKGCLKPYVTYKDVAGKENWVGFPDWTPTGQWQRFEGSCVVPSGMTPTYFGFNTSKATGDMEMLNPTFSYGSPVTLASGAHTPYATQDHLRSEYATKAALKVTSDAVTAEVTERGKLAGRVGTLESTTGTHASRLEQLAASITSLVKGESTYTDPDGKSATSGIYSLVEQTRDSVTALFGSYTKTADLASTQAVKDAKKAGTDAASAASAAQSTADEAKSNAATAQSTANAAKDTADSAESAANSAKSTAQAAASDAATAKTNASTAVSTANDASTDAANAVKTANAASSTASSASSKSDSAVSTANSAKSTADAAKTSAASAVSTANAASSTASSAKSTADSLATMIREDATGITVGKSADGKTWSTGRTRMTASAFQVLDKAGAVIAQLAGDGVSLLSGLVKLQARKSGANTSGVISSDFLSLDSLRQATMRAGKETSGAYVEGYAAAIADVTGRRGTARLYCTQGNGSRVTANNAFTVLPDGYDLSHPEYLAAALGLGAAEAFQAATTDSTLTYDSTTVLRWGRVCVMPFAVHYTSDWAPSEYAFFTLPEAVRPSVEQRGTVTSCPYDWTSDYRPVLVSIGTDGKVKLSGHAAGHWLGQLVWVV